MAEFNPNLGKSPDLAQAESKAAGALPEEPSLALRPTQALRRAAQRRDLQQPGWVALSPRGLEASSLLQSTEASQVDGDSDEGNNGQR